ncbi:hypothetical protein K7X08_009214 [Anisodus acutangulus]|uniref:C-JID domain-containing protein n=1 Tax=Anisodus acutangulus TaxID=402998 RepID=A0A9Q1MZG1_9SOLA|nr:hypothetical protein K7X08_009214 [Anisodus acutangulus]
MEKWRVALKEVAELEGMCLAKEVDGHEAKFIQKIIKEILKILNRTDMGKEIIRRESPDDPERLCKLLNQRGLSNYLTENNEMDADGGDLPCGRVEDGLVAAVGPNGAKTKLSRFARHSCSAIPSEDTGLVCHGYSRKHHKHLVHFDDASTEGSNSIELEADAFSRMQRLRILQLRYVRFTGFYSLFPKSLRLLCGSGFHIKTIPEDLPLESLVTLEMKKSHLENAWEGIKILISLKILNFSHSHFLKRTPDFSGLPHLKTLILKDCIKLVKIHESIGCLDGLVYLNLRDCKNLRKLPGSFYKLKSLEKLNISGCCRLVTSEIELGKLESLTTLQADGMNFGNANSRRVLWQTLSSKLRRSPGSNQFSFSSLSRSLVSLSLAKCNLTDDALSFGLCNLPSLCFLNLSENLIFLPASEHKKSWYAPRPLVGWMSEPPISARSSAKPCYAEGKRENLSEISGIFKLKPTDNFEVEILNTLGLLLNLDNTLDTAMEMFNRFTNKKRIYSVQQGLYEFGIFSTYFPGNEVPSWFNNRSKQSLLTLKVDSLPYINITGLTICVVYARSSPRKFRYFGDSKFRDGHSFYITVQNITKGLKWNYAPSFIGIPGENNRLTFLCHWKFGKYLQTGDQINVSLPCWSKTFNMKEFGVTLAYNKPELDQSSASISEARERHTPISDYQSEESVMEGFMPSYQLATAGSGSSDGVGLKEEEDDDDSICEYNEDEDDEATLAELEEMLQISW